MKQPLRFSKAARGSRKMHVVQAVFMDGTSEAVAVFDREDHAVAFTRVCNLYQMDTPARWQHLEDSSHSRSVEHWKRKHPLGRTKANEKHGHFVVNTAQLMLAW